MNQQKDPSPAFAATSERIEDGPSRHLAGEPLGKFRSAMTALASLCFILLQSACTAVMAVSGLRLVIGIGSLAFVTPGLKFLDFIHADAIRIPMTVLAGVGSFINLYVVWRIRSLRSRASSSWRSVAPAPETKRAEAIQIVLAGITWLLIAIEAVAHHHLFHAA